MTTTTTRTAPNVLVTGTPGTGKTTFCELLVAALGGPPYEAINVSELVKARGLHEGWDEEYQCFVLDEDKLLDEMENMLAHGHQVVDYHSSELFPERWFDLVIVLRTDNAILYERLGARGYSTKKIQENVECEIMQVPLDEARGSYRADIIVELMSNSLDDMERNVTSVQNLLANWQAPPNKPF